MINESFLKLLPNILTLLRIVLTPVCIFFLFKKFFLISLVIFLFASLSDFLDGYFARKYNSVSKVGAFLDPVADKMLVVGLFLSFYFLGIIIDVYILIMIIFRDVFVTILRVFMQLKGITMITSKISKLKTAIQFSVIMVIFMKLILETSNSDKLIYIISLLMAFLTFYTGIHYLISNYSQFIKILKIGK